MCIYNPSSLPISEGDVRTNNLVYREKVVEVEGEQVKKQRMNKASQDGNRRGPETSGEKLMHPEPLYKYHLRRGVDDGKRMATG